LPVLAAGGVRLGLRSVIRSPGAARWLSFRLSRCLFFTLFLIPGFPAVRDLRQELANPFNLFLGPEMDRHASASGGPGFGHLTGLDVANKRGICDAKFLGRLPSGIRRVHSVGMLQIDRMESQGEFA